MMCFILDIIHTFFFSASNYAPYLVGDNKALFLRSIRALQSVCDKKSEIE